MSARAPVDGSTNMRHGGGVIEQAHSRSLVARRAVDRAGVRLVARVPGHPVLELAHPPAQAPSGFGKALGAQDDEGDDQNDDDFWGADGHGGLLSRAVSRHS